MKNNSVLCTYKKIQNTFEFLEVYLKRSDIYYHVFLFFYSVNLILYLQNAEMLINKFFPEIQTFLNVFIKSYIQSHLHLRKRCIFF